MDDLEATIKRLEVAEVGSRELDAEIALTQGWECKNLQRPFFDDVAVWTNPTGEIVYAGKVPRYTTSIDAALTLVPEGWWVYLRMCRNINATNYYHCTLECSCDSLDRDMSDDDPDELTVENMPSAALALCIAALRSRSLHTSGDGE